MLQRSGKSFLVRRLAKHYKGKCFLEGEEKDFPKRILEDISKNIRPLERILWFRNKLVKRYNQAIRLKEQGQVVVLDTFWLSLQLFIDVLLKSFERKIAWELVADDTRMLGWPDVIIFLDISEEGIRKFIAKGRRSFDKSEEFIRHQALPVNNMHKQFFSKRHMAGRVLTIKRDSLDFAKKQDFYKLLKKIDTFLARKAND